MIKMSIDIFRGHHKAKKFSCYPVSIPDCSPDLENVFYPSGLNWIVIGYNVIFHFSERVEKVDVF